MNSMFYKELWLLIFVTQFWLRLTSTFRKLNLCDELIAQNSNIEIISSYGEFVRSNGKRSSSIFWQSKPLIRKSSMVLWTNWIAKQQCKDVISKPAQVWFLVFPNIYITKIMLPRFINSTAAWSSWQKSLNNVDRILLKMC